MRQQLKNDEDTKMMMEAVSNVKTVTTSIVIWQVIMNFFMKGVMAKLIGLI